MDHAIALSSTLLILVVPCSGSCPWLRLGIGPPPPCMERHLSRQPGKSGRSVRHETAPVATLSGTGGRT